MARLSLRATISVLSSTFVAIVAVLTLSVTLTTSLAALRELADKHATALVQSVELETAKAFDAPAKELLVLSNFTVAHVNEHGTSPDSLFDELAVSIQQSFLALRGVANVAPFDIALLSGGYIRAVGRLPTPNLYAILMRNVSSTPASLVIVVYDLTTNSRVPQSDSRYSEVVSHLQSSGMASLPPLAAYLPALQALNFTMPGPGLLATTGVDSVMGVSQIGRQLPYYVIRQIAILRVGHDLFGLVAAVVRVNTVATAFSTPAHNGGGRAAFVLDRIGNILSTTREAEESWSRVVPAPIPGCNCTAAASGTEWWCQHTATSYGESGYPPLASFDTNKHFGGVGPGGQRTVRFRHDGSMFHAAVARPAVLFHPNEVYAVQIVPEEEVVGDVLRSRDVAIGVSCAVFVVVATSSFVMIWHLLRPLTRIAERMTKAAVLADEEPRDPPSAMAEVAELQDAYYAMNDELRRIRSFLPQALLHRHDDSDNSDNDQGVAGTRSRRSYRSRRSGQGKSRRNRQRDDARLPDDGQQHADNNADDFYDGSSDDSLDGIVGATSTTIGSTAVASLQCYVERANVTVVVCNSSGFHGAVTRAATTTMVVAASAAMVDIVMAEMSTRRGVLLSFHGDHFVATFNAARRCRDHQAAGAAAALALVEALPAGSPFRLAARVGVATSTCLVGNLGSHTTRSFSTVGPAYSQALVLERMTRLYGPACSVLANRRAALGAFSVAEVVFLDIVDLAGRGSAKPSPIAALIPRDSDPFAPWQPNPEIAHPDAMTTLTESEHPAGDSTTSHPRQLHTSSSTGGAAVADSPSVFNALSSDGGAKDDSGSKHSTLPTAASGQADADATIPTQSAGSSDAGDVPQITTTGTDGRNLIAPGDDDPDAAWYQQHPDVEYHDAALLDESAERLEFRNRVFLLLAAGNYPEAMYMMGLDALVPADIAQAVPPSEGGTTTDGCFTAGERSDAGGIDYEQPAVPRAAQEEEHDHRNAEEHDLKRQPATTAGDAPHRPSIDPETVALLVQQLSDASAANQLSCDAGLSPWPQQNGGDCAHGFIDQLPGLVARTIALLKSVADAGDVEAFAQFVHAGKGFSYACRSGLRVCSSLGEFYDRAHGRRAAAFVHASSSSSAAVAPAAAAPPQQPQPDEELIAAAGDTTAPPAAAATSAA